MPLTPYRSTEEIRPASYRIPWWIKILMTSRLFSFDPFTSSNDHRYLMVASVIVGAMVSCHYGFAQEWWCFLLPTAIFAIVSFAALQTSIALLYCYPCRLLKSRTKGWLHREWVRLLAAECGSENEIAKIYRIEREAKSCEESKRLWLHLREVYRLHEGAEIDKTPDRAPSEFEANLPRRWLTAR